MTPREERALRDIPSELYHYTTAAGFVGIMSSGVLRATNFAFLNDSSELLYGQEIADRLCQIKDDNPALSVSAVVDEARADGVGEELHLAPATVHRLLSRHGLMDKQPQEPTSKDRRRFAFDKAGELWMSDVMHGPAVPTENGRKRKSYLIALLDDATRVVPFAAFALAENTSAFLPVLHQAILRRGVPKRLYVDNGASRAWTPSTAGCADGWRASITRALIGALTTRRHSTVPPRTE